MASQREVDRIQFLWLLALDAPCFCYHQLEVHSPREPRCDLVLHVEEVHARLIEALRPEMCARFCVDELRIHAQAIRAALNTAFQYVANASSRPTWRASTALPLYAKAVLHATTK